MIKPKGKDQYAKAVEYSHTLEDLLIMERENSAALRDELEAVERERDELKALAESQSELAGRNATRAQKAEAEIARRDAAAGEAVAVVDIQRGRGDGKKFALCYTSAGHSLPDDVYNLYTAEPPAVLPPEKGFTGYESEAERQCVWGYNEALGDVRALGAQPQKPVFLPAERFCAAEYAGSLLWAETEVWNKAIYECAASLDAANIQYEVKK